MKALFITICLTGLLAAAIGCDEEEAPQLMTGISISGKVFNNSSEPGKIIVEFDNSRRDVADLSGNYEIFVHADTWVDSLYAWVDVNLDGQYNNGEPNGHYPNGFQVNNTNVTELDFTIQ